MNEVVFDASAILALINDEPGSKTVESYLGRAAISAVNFSEVIVQLIKRGIPDNTAIAIVSGFSLQIIDFDEKMAFDAACLITITHKVGLSFGDRACLALARNLKIPAVTADRAWSKVKFPVDIKIIR